MQCEKCHEELAPNSVSCPKCGAPALQNIIGFENTAQIQRQLRIMMKEYGDRLLPIMRGTLFIDTELFTALLSDFISDFEKECSLLRNMVRDGILLTLLKDGKTNRDMAYLNAKTYMCNEKFISENAAEFVITSLTYMLGWPYDSPLRIKESDGTEEEEDEEKRPLIVEERVFRSIDAAKNRLRANITIADGFTKMDGFCFDGFTMLHTVKLPEGMLVIGEYAFSGCKRLRSIELPASLRLIERGAFANCGKLISVRIPQGILEIADSTFSFCTSLETIEIPDTVSSIGVEAFAGCEKMRRLTLPESVKFIDKNAFAYCPKLEIYCIENSYVHKYCLNNRIPFTPQPSSNKKGK